MHEKLIFGAYYTFKFQGKEKEIMTISLMSDLFVSILFLSLKQRIDMREVLKHALTQIPLSLLSFLVWETSKYWYNDNRCNVFLSFLVDPPSTFNSSVYTWLHLFNNGSWDSLCIAPYILGRLTQRVVRFILFLII